MEDARRSVERLMARLPVDAASAPLVQTALTHRSWANEYGQALDSNERLEFLGDSVLGLVIARALFHRMAGADEGRLSKARARLVSATVLARRAQALNLGQDVLLGRGEAASGGRARVSILANVMEAVIGMVFQARGLETAEGFILGLWQDEIAQEVAGLSAFDAKTRLQEYCQKRFGSLPHYRVEKIAGPDHDRSYHVVVEVSGRVVGRGSGPSKKQAEQASAETAWDALENTGHENMAS